MLTNERSEQKISLMTLGCSKNVVDSENLLGLLQTNRFNIEENPNNADILIINTCGFIKPAKEESIQLIFEGVARKHSGKLKKLIVMGCLSQRYEKELKEQIDDVDYFFGVNDIEQIVRTLNQDLKKNLIGERVLLTPKHYAYFKISEGCNHTCSFCAIPLIRGRQVSRSIESLVSEAQTLASKGTKELIVIAQDSTNYGLDLYNERKLPELFVQLSDVKGIEWLRLHYAYPTKFPLEFLDVVKEKENICNYIDIPIQHISDKLLTSMRRGINSEKIRKLLDEMRNRVPNIAIRSTFIVGYPGENEDDFNQLYDFISEQQLDRVGVFTYSQEESTRAFVLGDTIPEKVKNERRDALMKLQSEISLKKNINKIGKTFKVLIDERNTDTYIGRTEFDSPDVDNLVHIPYSPDIKRGNFYNVKIERAEEYDLYGNVI